MGAALFTNYLENQLDSSAPDLDVGNVRANLLDMDTEGIAIVSSTNATPIVVTTGAHGLATGDRVSIQGHTVNTNANGTYQITVLSTTTFSLQNDTDGADRAGNGVGGADGTIMDLEQITLDELTGVIATSANLVSTTIVGGTFDADNVTFTSVTGATVEAICIYEETGTPTTSNLVAFLGSDTVTGLPVTPNGGDITITWATGGIFTVSRTAPG